MDTHSWRATLLLSCTVCTTALAQPDPTLEQVYSAARGGHIQQALQMMQPVLRDHPDSPKAHYVEAELLANQGEVNGARRELAAAEHLSPGLPFARPEAVQGLRWSLERTPATPHPGASFDPGSDPAPRIPLPWGALIGLFGGLGMAWLIWTLWRRAGTGVAAGATTWPGLNPASPGAGLGSALAGGLASGLGVGAGIVAAEAIGEHFLRRDGAPVEPVPIARDAGPDLGGSDFGVQDHPGGWDDSAGGNDDSDWSA